jgi:hypothetical protein
MLNNNLINQDTKMVFYIIAAALGQEEEGEVERKVKGCLEGPRGIADVHIINVNKNLTFNLPP